MKQEPKFKVGDVVRNVAPLSSYHGLIGQVKDCFVEPGYGTCYAVDWFKGKVYYTGTSKKIYEHALELYSDKLKETKYKVGDEVLCINRKSSFRGYKGIVIKVFDVAGQEQEVAVDWKSTSGGSVGGSRMKASGVELVSSKSDKDPYAELKKAYADGKTIQMKQESGVWVDLNQNREPRWIWDVDTYRIKPDPYAELKKAYAEGKTIEMYAKSTGRWNPIHHVPKWDSPVERYRVKPEEPRLVPDGGVRVGELTVIVGRPGAGASHFMSTEVAKQKSTNQQKENTMKLELTTRHFLNGKDISEITLAQLYQTIGMAEQDIRELEKIENKPKRLVKEIEKRKADLKALVDFLDAQDSKDA